MQRLLEIETYRMMALVALPLVQDHGPHAFHELVDSLQPLKPLFPQALDSASHECKVGTCRVQAVTDAGGYPLDIRREPRDGLHPPSMGARVTFPGGKPKVTDGPFAEAKEVIGGYWIIQVK